MTTDNRWLLPEGIEEVLPPTAAELDRVCRRILDLYASFGYELVIPPLIEHLESLLTGTGEDLELQTFKLTDQLSGRTLGVRADSTPQVVRIDVHNLKRRCPTRLCYLGPVLHTRPTGRGGARELLQTGAELYGSSSRESEAEIIVLMLKTLACAGLKEIHIDLGHVGIYRGITDRLGLAKAQAQILFDILQRKATAELREVIEQWTIPAAAGEALLTVVDLNGDSAVLESASRVLAGQGDEVLRSIEELRQTASLVNRRYPNAPIYFDLAELRGYHYYTGMSFAAYIPGLGQGIAFGGRYDDIGKAFGTARPAIGFSADIRALFGLAARPLHPPRGVFAPVSEDPECQRMIDHLRDQNERVVCALPDQADNAVDHGCDRILIRKEGIWKVRDLG
ncbi:MAG: ATP phosphoribosyltransferase regulatory subunit [Gammaproteobacteria bacterium]|jgi:ATP phosphoribosyltransferase regulatory subunit|nr:MAG: ATP phosphoribosyltransferase regulatory subunit [Gammaproteobacteria bacterium]